MSAKNETAKKFRFSVARRPIMEAPQSSQAGVIVPCKRGRRVRRQHPQPP
jgi:hypothetical protein